MKKFHIPCKHDTGEVASSVIVSDYHPLNRAEFDELIKQASQEKNASILSSIQARFVQAIRGMVCPHPASGPVSEKLAAVDEAFMKFHYGTGRASAIWEIIASS